MVLNFFVFIKFIISTPPLQKKDMLDILVLALTPSSEEFFQHLIEVLGIIQVFHVFGKMEIWHYDVFRVSHDIDDLTAKTDLLKNFHDIIRVH